MKTKIFNLIIVVSLLILLLELLQHKPLIFNTISYSLNIWTTTLIPSMFPSFIISDILISYHITNYIPKPIKKTLIKIFHINEPSLSVLFLSSLSGFPSNARLIRNLYDNKIITKEEASQTLTFTHFSNPLFILSTIAIFFLNNENYGYIILISHYLGNLILAISTRKYRQSYTYHYNPTIIKSQNFSTILMKAIRSAIDSLLTISGTLTCFLVLSSLIIKHLNISSYNSTLIKGILEITMGLKSLALLNISDCYKIVISTIFISFGGLSVHLQVLSQLTDTDIPYQPFFISRIFHAILSGGLSYLLYILIF